MTENKYLVVATEDELKLPEAVAAQKERDIIITGVGGVNAIRAVRDLSREADILNVGYVGGRGLPIGTAVEIGWVLTFHPNVDFISVADFLGGTTDCYTAGDFVLDGRFIPDKAVVDMELAYIAAMGFKYLRSIKYVSDNFNYKEYERTIKTRV